MNLTAIKDFMKKFSILPVDHPGIKFRFRLKSINAVLFVPVGRVNMLTIILIVLTGFFLVMGIAAQSEADSPQQIIAGIGGMVIFLTAVVYTFMGMEKPMSTTESTRLLLASSGTANPSRVARQHPERVEIYHRLVTDLGANGNRPSDALQNASALILSGVFDDTDSDLLIIALQRGAVTKAEITSLVEELRKDAVTALIQGML